MLTPPFGYISDYVQRSITMDPSIISLNPGIPLLFYAFRGLNPDIETLSSLLQLGADPNQLWCGNTSWQYYLTLIHSEDHRSTETERGRLSRVFKVMLESGASPLTTCTHNHNVLGPLSKASHSVLNVIRDVLRGVPEKVVSEVHEIYNQRRTSWDITNVGTSIPPEFSGQGMKRKGDCSGYVDTNYKRRKWWR